MSKLSFLLLTLLLLEHVEPNSEQISRGLRHVGIQGVFPTSSWARTCRWQSRAFAHRTIRARWVFCFSRRHVFGYYGGHASVVVVVVVLVVVLELWPLHPAWVLSTHLQACFRYEMTFCLMVVLIHLLVGIKERILGLLDRIGVLVLGRGLHELLLLGWS